jgi:peptidoglycan/xylan/chitin deacetylase (PgdA/CDA1 family)
MVKVILDNQEKFKPEAKYVFETFFEIMGVSFSFVDTPQEAQDKDVLLYYGLRPQRVDKDKISIPEDAGLMSNGRQPKLKFIEGTPVIYIRDFAENSLILEDDPQRGIAIGADIIAASFYLLSRQEEKTNKQRDVWGCFSAVYSLSSSWQIIETPVVNLYIELLLGLIRKLSQRKGVELKELPRWKGGKRFAVALTHDVDNLRKYSIANAAKKMLKKILRGEGSFSAGMGLLKMSVLGRHDSDPFWSFEDFIELESSFGFKSTFYFFSQSTNRRFDPFYRLNGPLRRQIRNISQRGWEVGLHGSYESYLSQEMLKNQKKKLEGVLNGTVLGLRQHYLRLCVERTFPVQEQAGFVYDSSLGYNEAVGFRAGLSAPFFPYDVNLRRKSNILELPLGIMDGSLFEFNRLGPQEALRQAKKIIDSVERVGGLLVILWHTKARDEKDYPGWWDVYVGILRYLREKEGWVTCASEICTWWLERLKDVRNLRDG